MLYRMGAIVKKELRTFFRDPATMRFLTAVPIVQVLIFAFAATLDVRNVQIAVVNEDNGKWSTEFVARVEAAGFVKTVHRVDSLERADEMVDARRIIMALHFPADFSRDIAQGLPATVQVLVDGRRANSGQISLGYLNSVALELGASIQAGRGAVRAIPEAEVRHWFNPNLEYRWFIVPALGATMAMVMSLLLSTLSIARERELGTFDQLLVSPVSTIEIITAKTIPGIIGGVFIGVMVIGMAVFGFGVPFEGNLLYLLLSLVIFVLALVGVGLTISSICSTQQQAVLGMFFGMIPFILISGFATPVENMPLFLQYLAEISPLKHFLIIIHGCYLKSMTFSDVAENGLPLLIIAAVTLTTAGMITRARIR